jgi:hypothetical protein
MVTRASKETLRTLLRTAMQRFRLPTKEPYIAVVVEYLNLLLGTSSSSTKYWQDEMLRTIRMSFFYQTDIEFKMEDLVIEKPIIMKALLSKMGITMTQDKAYEFTKVDFESSCLTERNTLSLPLISKTLHRKQKKWMLWRSRKDFYYIAQTRTSLIA